MPSTSLSKRSYSFYNLAFSTKKALAFLLLCLVFSAISFRCAAQAAPGKCGSTRLVAARVCNTHAGTTTFRFSPCQPVQTLTRIGMFSGQSDVGAALAPGSSSYNKATGQYTINSAGYNIWYTRDEFRYLWKKMSGDVSLAADVSFPDSAGYNDRKAVVIIRQNLEDDAKEAMVALHGAGLMHLAWRPEKNAMLKEMRIEEKSAQRIGIEKHGDSFTLFVSMNGEPMHQLGEPVTLHLDGPFYVGIGFCSHLPATVDTGVLSNVVLENAAGKVK